MESSDLNQIVSIDEFGFVQFWNITNSDDFKSIELKKGLGYECQNKNM